MRQGARIYKQSEVEERINQVKADEKARNENTSIGSAKSLEAQVRKIKVERSDDVTKARETWAKLFAQDS